MPKSYDTGATLWTHSFSHKMSFFVLSVYMFFFSYYHYYFILLFFLPRELSTSYNFVDSGFQTRCVLPCTTTPPRWEDFIRACDYIVQFWLVRYCQRLLQSSWSCFLVQINTCKQVSSSVNTIRLFVITNCMWRCVELMCNTFSIVLSRLLL